MPSVNRKENYKRLKEAGFNSYEANRFKDYGTSYVTKLINLQLKFKEELKKCLKSES